MNRYHYFHSVRFHNISTYPEVNDLKPEKKQILKKFISDTNGHPRSLAMLKYTCEDLSWNLESYQLLFYKWYDILKKYTILVPSTEMVKAALIGEAVDVDDIIPGESMTYRQAIIEGYYLNSMDNIKIIPQLSPILLLCYAHNTLSSGSSVEDVQLAQSIFKLLELEQNWTCYVSELIFNNIQSFEHFHGHYEILRRLLYKDQHISLAKFYKFPKLAKFTDFTFKSTNKEIIELTTHFPNRPIHITG